MLTLYFCLNSFSSSLSLCLSFVLCDICCAVCTVYHRSGFLFVISVAIFSPVKYQVCSFTFQFCTKEIHLLALGHLSLLWLTKKTCRVRIKRKSPHNFQENRTHSQTKQTNAYDFANNIDRMCILYCNHFGWHFGTFFPFVYFSFVQFFCSLGLFCLVLCVVRAMMILSLFWHNFIIFWPKYRLIVDI